MEVATELEPKAGPRRGSELADSIKAPMDTGVVVAIFPGQVTLRQEAFQGLMALFGTMGKAGERLLDVQGAKSENMRWWLVTRAASYFKCDLVPVVWSGAISEIPERYFAPGTYLGVRFYRHGPWFWPLEQPEITRAK